MPTTITGTDGVSQVQDGVVTADDLAAGVGGKVLQVVQTSSGTDVSINDSTYVELLTLNITPTSADSEILVIFTATVLYTSPESDRYRGNVKISADGSAIQTYIESPSLRFSGAVEFNSYVATTKLHAPSTTNSVTYSVDASSASGQMNWGAFGNEYVLTLMEIAG